MPIQPSSGMSNLILTRAAGFLLGGQKMKPIVDSISSACVQYFLASFRANTVNNVLGPGSGTSVGTVTGIFPTGMASQIKRMAEFLRVGGGSHSDRFFNAVSFGVVQALNTATMNGIVIGGGPGSGYGKVFGLSGSALKPLILNRLSFKVGRGSKADLIFTAVSSGICNYLNSSASINNVCIGTFSPPPVGPVPIPSAPGNSFL